MKMFKAFSLAIILVVLAVEITVDAKPQPDPLDTINIFFNFGYKDQDEPIEFNDCGEYLLL